MRENQNSNTMKTEVREYAQDPKKYASKDEKDESSLKQKLLEYLKILIVTISTFFETMKKIFEYLIVKEQLKENFKKKKKVKKHKKKKHKKKKHKKKHIE